MSLPAIAKVLLGSLSPCRSWIYYMPALSFCRNWNVAFLYQWYLEPIYESIHENWRRNRMKQFWLTSLYGFIVYHDRGHCQFCDYAIVCRLGFTYRGPTVAERHSQWVKWKILSQRVNLTAQSFGWKSGPCIENLQVSVSAHQTIYWQLEQNSYISVSLSLYENMMTSIK